MIVTGADNGSLDPARLTVGFGDHGTHSVALTMLRGLRPMELPEWISFLAAPATTVNGVSQISGGSGNDTIIGSAGNYRISGNAAQTF